MNKVVVHKVTVKKENLTPGRGWKRQWVARCRGCGDWQGYFNKLKALQWARAHEEAVA